MIALPGGISVPDPFSLASILSLADSTGSKILPVPSRTRIPDVLGLVLKPGNIIGSLVRLLRVTSILIGDPLITVTSGELIKTAKDEIISCDNPHADAHDAATMYVTTKQTRALIENDIGLLPHLDESSP
jgi:hypothetical protein